MKRLTCLFCFLVLSACNIDKTPFQVIGSASGFTGEEIKIYQAVFQNIDEVAVIVDSTQAPDIWMNDSIPNLQEYLPGLSDETIQDYLTVNQESVKLSSLRGLPGTHYFVSVARSPDWKTLHPDATVRLILSRIGFNLARNQALVYYSEYSAPLVGTGSLIFLRKESAGWKIKKIQTIWIS